MVRYQMQIELNNGLPFTPVTIQHQGQRLLLPQVLLDTGSSACVFMADKLLQIGIQIEPNDSIHRITGIGGSEFVFNKTLDKLCIGDIQIKDFAVEVGMMDYGFSIDGIIGMDFLIKAQVRIDFKTLYLTL